MAVRSKPGICLGNSEEELEGAVWPTERTAASSSARGKRVRIRIIASQRIMSSEELQMDGQVFLGVLADSCDQVSRLHQQLIGIVVQRRIHQELAGTALAFIEPVGDAVQARDRV